MKVFGSKETVKIYSLKNYVNTNITKINLDTQSYLNQLTHASLTYYGYVKVIQAVIKKL